MNNAETGAAREAAEDGMTDRELGEAGARLSTAPAEQAVSSSLGGIRGPVAGGWRAGRQEAVGWARWFWRQLTSMRVALILLFLLALGAVPGSLVPQNSVDDLKVRTWKEQNETLTPVFERLQLFDVYSSVWFSAIYILLFASLVGCIVPRTWQFVGQLRSRPPAAPRRLDRVPAYATWRTDADPQEVRSAALALLKRRRFRAHVPGDAIAAEKGYLREMGNLVFHVALIIILAGFAVGQLFKSEGTKLIVEGDGFSNTPTQYDDFRSGSLFQTEDLEPFSFTLNQFTGTYEKSGPQKGTPREYRADITYSVPADGAEKKTVVEVNKPLKVGDSKAYLLWHGYAPVVSVTDSRGKVVYRSAVPLLPVDANITSTGAIKVADGYRNKRGEKEQLGFQAFFVPTFAGSGNSNMFSQFPGLSFPVLALNAYHGSLGIDSGLPQNVYQLDTRKMKPFKDSKGQRLKQLLLPGEVMELPGGAGAIKFEGVKEWASFQISQEPGEGVALVGAVAAVLGLTASLFVRRRRVWVRVRKDADGTTVVEMAGLGRTESAKVAEELADLAADLHIRAPSVPGPAPAGIEATAETEPGTDAEDSVEGARA
jgi:cytochrome c biogenesis protein